MKKTVALLLLLVVLSSVCVFAQTNQFISIETSGGFSYYFSDLGTNSSSSMGFSVYTGWENEDFAVSLEAQMSLDSYAAAFSYSRFFNNGLYAIGEVGVGASTTIRGFDIGGIGIFGVRLAGIGRSWMDIGLGLNYNYVKYAALDETYSDLALCLVLDDYCPISDSLTLVCGATIGDISIFSKYKESAGTWENNTDKFFGIIMRAGLKYSFPAEGFKPHLKTK